MLTRIPHYLSYFSSRSFMAWTFFSNGLFPVFFPLLPLLFLLFLHVPHPTGHFFPHTYILTISSWLQGQITLSGLGRARTLRSTFPAVPFSIICSLQLLIRIKNDPCRSGNSWELNVTVLYPWVQRQQAQLWAAQRNVSFRWLCLFWPNFLLFAHIFLNRSCAVPGGV